MRAFVALEVSEAPVLDALESLQRELRATGADIKLVERENLHFTIKFLGEISEQEAGEVDRRLKSLHVPGAAVRLSGVGAFPGLGRPRVIWAGLGPGGAELLGPLGESVISALRGIGQEERRPFEPHITLARVRSGKNLAQLASFLRTRSGADFGEIAVKEIRFKSSLLRPSGPVYSDLGVYPLA